MSPAEHSGIAAEPPSTSNFQEIKYEIQGQIAIVSLNRPKIRNPISRKTTEELDNAFKAAAADDAVKVIILRGEGSCFSSGHDLGSPSRKDDKIISNLEARGVRGTYEVWSSLDVEMCLKWRQLPKPIIAAVHGYVIFHATALVSICDLVVAAEGTKFMPTMLQYCSLPYDLGLNIRKAKEIMFTQRFMLAEELEQLGIVNRVVPLDKLMSEATALASLICDRCDPFQLRMMKASANSMQDAAGFTTSLRYNLGYYATRRASGNDEGASNVADWRATKRMAPIAEGEQGESMYWSTTAPLSASSKRGRSKL
ncbi:hypothetical protein SmJEL517_g05886 [Synchytrium microbalum]|uniref:Enoyl-CoA hydratase n=1 Tax=Synchytrium microbalum TaxID=1806994 RepID=A0A507BSE0_9FUNG|nr:uncharacterized protein SmJEL517_g05886 [Synchytrium microbalum]TPX30582.1 hypothetical protein SmJEL517_g05886 [Synchytrium microbalum]